MGIYQQFKCDRCGTVSDYPKGDIQPCTVAVGVNFGLSLPAEIDMKYQVWCRECVMKAGIYPPYSDSDKAVAPEAPLTFEEKFILLIEELGFTRQE
jgi:hypothetical protein